MIDSTAFWDRTCFKRCSRTLRLGKLREKEDMECITDRDVQVILGTVEAFTKKGIRTSSGNEKPDVDTKVLVIKFNT